jgi:hypothetical protein
VISLAQTRDRFKRHEPRGSLHQAL